MSDILADKLDQAAAQLANAAKGVRNGTLSLETDMMARMGVIFVTKDVLDAVQQPLDTIFDTIVSVAQLVAARLFIDWNVFENIPLEGSISYQELAAKVSAEAPLVNRIAWVLVSTGVLKQEGVDRVSHTPKSMAYATPGPMRSMVLMGFDHHMASIIAMPDYFAKFGRVEPVTRRGTVFAWANDVPEMTVWETMNRDPAKMATFMTAMELFAAMYPFLGSYDLSWVVSTGAADSNKTRKLVVDVGGGKGHALKAIVKATPGLDMSRCVLQDLPEVVAASRALNDPELVDAEMQGIDFHEEQPVKGALVYYLRRCLHDYGDDECVGILAQISGAMEADSRLLIVDQVMGNPPKAVAAAMDMFMATISGKERTLEGFVDIAGKAGLKVEKAWRSEGTDVAIVECVKL